MSRSHRKNPFFGYAHSEKEDKRIANRQFRRLTRKKLKRNDEDLPRSVDDVSHGNRWGWAKDGRPSRFDPDANPKMLRK